MTEPAATPGTTVRLIRRVSSRAEAGVSPTVLLERVCEAVVDALAFDRIAGVRYHTRAGEVSEVAVAGIPSAKRAERRPLASVPLLAEALDAQNLVFASDGRAGELTWAFALPLISGERCLGFLSGKRRQVVPPDKIEGEALAIVGIVVAALLESEARCPASTGSASRWTSVAMRWLNEIDSRCARLSANKPPRCELWSNNCSTSPVSTWRRLRSRPYLSVYDRGSRSSFLWPQVLAGTR